MTLRTYQNHTPTLAAGAFVDISAVVIGDVEIGADSSVWPLTVIRGDMHRIRIGARTSVQDGSAAAKADIAAGDVIVGINGRPIASVSAIARAMKGDAKRGVDLDIRHDGESRYKHLPPTRVKEPHVPENTRRRG